MRASPSKVLLLKYSFLALPLAFAGLPLYVHAPDFYTRDLGLNIGLIGIILLFIRLFDAFQDPVIGYLSDKYASQRFYIIAGGTTMLMIGMAAVFYGPLFEISVALWFALSMILATTGFSIVTINFNMIGGLWHDQSQQRTRISAWREAFMLIGLLIASMLPTILQNFNPSEQAFRILFIIFALLMITGFIMFARFIKTLSPAHKINKNSTKKGLSFWVILTGPDRHFFGVCFLTHIAAAIPAIMVLFFIRDYLNAEDLTGLFLLLYFIAGAALIAFWVKLAHRIGRERAWFISMILAVATFIWAYFLEPGDIIAYAIICVLSGMALGADLALPPSILADRITQQKTETEATQYYALLALIAKTALAVASGISFLTLDALSFAPGAQNTADIMQGVITLYAMIPCLIKLCAAFYLWHYFKNQESLHKNIKRSDYYGTHGVS
ncbi:MAG: MFS transporter [Pseudomonadota bacterium]